MFKPIVNNSKVSQNNLCYVPMLTNNFHVDMKVFTNRIFLNIKNTWIVKSIEICLKNDIRVFLFTSPICSNNDVAEFDKIEKLYKIDYFDFSNYFGGNISYFSDQMHLNSRGADNFTKALGLFLRNGILISN